jgi:hypothetical protein
MPSTGRGIIRLWLVIGVIWSIGWLLFVAWRDVVDQISPITTDFFLLPLIILAPWLITASALVGRWVAVGFNSSNLTAGSDRHAILFVQHASQYYATARFAMHAQCMPVCGILFHHTVEMLLKGGGCTKAASLRVGGHEAPAQGDMADFQGRLPRTKPGTAQQHNCTSRQVRCHPLSGWGRAWARLRRGTARQPKSPPMAV